MVCVNCLWFLAQKSVKLATCHREWLFFPGARRNGQQKAGLCFGAESLFNIFFPILHEINFCLFSGKSNISVNILTVITKEFVNLLTV